MTQQDGRSESASERIASFIAEFDLRAAPDALIDTVETAFVDTVGVMLAGSREPAAVIVCDMIADEGAAPAATVVGRPLRTSPLNAALANGTATQAMDFDLSFMSGQSAAAVIPALLPLSETRDAAPAELIAAFVIGGEVAARVVRSFPTLSSQGGWHGAGIVGAIATAAACARLMRAPVATVPAIIGIAASTAAGLGANYGTMTKPLHPGLAARNGMMAAFLGARGFSASAAAIEGRQGLLDLLGRGFEWDAAPFDDLGRVFNLLDPGYKIKPFACGGLLHTSIEAMLALRDDALPRLDRIERILVGATQHANTRVIDRYPWSADSSRFSLKYLLPHTLIHGAPTLATFTEQAMADARVRALSGRVTTQVDADFPDTGATGHSPARVTILFDDGTRLEKAVYHASGSKDAPMSAAAIRAKFDDCAVRVIGEAAASRLYDVLGGFGGRKTLRDLWPLLAAGR